METYIHSMNFLLLLFYFHSKKKEKRLHKEDQICFKKTISVAKPTI
jgi:hypothetical protein